MSSRNYLSWEEPTTRNELRYQTLPNATNATTVENHLAHLREPLRCGPPFTALKDPPPGAAELFPDPKGIGPRTRTLHRPQNPPTVGYRSFRNPPAEEGRNPQRLKMDLDTIQAYSNPCTGTVVRGSSATRNETPWGPRSHRLPHLIVRIPRGINMNPGGVGLQAGLFWVPSPHPLLRGLPESLTWQCGSRTNVSFACCGN
jgi:hypothetical protein